MRHSVMEILFKLLELRLEVEYLAVSQNSDNREPQSFHMLLESGSYGCSQLLQNTQGLLDLQTTNRTVITTVITFNPEAKLRTVQLTRILLESVSRPFSARGSSPMLAVMNLASEMMAAASSRPSFLIFQFLSPILDTRSDVILSL